MLRIRSPIVHENNLVFVLVAGVICLRAAFTALTAFTHARHATSRRLMLVGAAALVARLGIWVTHFIAMLVYEPAFPITCDVPRTVLSVLVAVTISGLGWIVALDRRPVRGFILFHDWRFESGSS